MTREEAIKMAKADLKCMKRDTSGQDEMCNSHKCDECRLNYERGNIGDQKEWLRLAIKALEQEPCEDAISRKEVRNTIFRECSGEKLDIDFAKVLLLQRKIKALQPVQPKPKAGHWIDIKNKNGTVIAVRCSRCGNSPKHAIKSDFCPNCGTDMREVKE